MDILKLTIRFQGKILKIIYLFLITCPILAQNSDDSKDILQTFSNKLDSIRQQNHIPGLAVGIVQDQESVWSKGFGKSHFDTGDGAAYQQVTPNTPFWIASLTKTFLGLLFLQLEDDGSVDLDDQINNLPKWSGFCNWLANSTIIFGKDLRCEDPITIRNILNHTVNGEPGTQFRYNPIMYSRLSRYIEYIHGNSIDQAEIGHNKLAELVQEKILGPAKMDRTMSSQWQRSKPLVFFDMAQGYGYQDGKYKSHQRPERHLAGGAGIVSTIEDLAKYDIALDQGLLANDLVMAKLFTPPVNPDGVVLPYAFGWYVQKYKGEKLVWHSGWDEEAGFSALYLKVPERNITFILLANSGGLWWGNPLDSAEVHKSPFAKLFIDTFLTNE